MKQLTTILTVIAMLTVFSIVQNSASQDEKTISLFNGKNLDGWHIYVKDNEAKPEDVWKVKDGAMWCSGEPFGFIRTKQEFTDFKLTLEWKWPEEPTNSGVLLRMTDEDKIWPLCMEAQLKYQSAGDAVGMGCDFNEDQSEEGSFFRFARKKHETNETEPGQWNTYEIICKGDTMELTVNGKLQNKSTGICVEKGFIGLQSEGSPIMFRNLKVTPLK